MPSYRYPIAVEGAFHPSKPQDYAVIFNVRRAVQYGAAFSPAVDLQKDQRGYSVTSGIPANAIIQMRTSLGQCVNHNSLGSIDWEYLTGRKVDHSDPTLRITEMPSLELYHEDLSHQERQVWNHSIVDAQQLSEDYMDDSMSNRALTIGLPPTNISYAEFKGMRAKTMSYMSSRMNNKSSTSSFQEEHQEFF